MWVSVASNTEVHDLLSYTSCSSWLTSMLIQQAMAIGLDSYNVKALNTTIYMLWMPKTNERQHLA